MREFVLARDSALSAGAAPQKKATKEFVLAQDELEILCESLPKSGVVLLRGDLASGKTTLVRALAKFKGSQDEVNSPTFSLLHSYECDKSVIYHYDIYTDGFAGLLQRGLCENLFEKGLHLVEWGDENLERYLQKMGAKCVKVEISNYKNKRKYVIYE